jgi:hypothetical protein
VEFLEWGVAVDEQDGVVGSELGHGDEAARQNGQWAQMRPSLFIWCLASLIS